MSLEEEMPINYVRNIEGRGYKYKYDGFPSKLVSSTDLDKLGIKWLMRDQLDQIDFNKANIYILNLDNSDGHGTHWVLAVVSPKNKSFYYIDSFNMQFDEFPELQELVKKHKFTFVHNNFTFQYRKSWTCGYIAVFLHDLITPRLYDDNQLTREEFTTVLNYLTKRPSDSNVEMFIQNARWNGIL